MSEPRFPSCAREVYVAPSMLLKEQQEINTGPCRADWENAKVSRTEARATVRFLKQKKDRVWRWSAANCSWD